MKNNLRNLRYKTRIFCYILVISLIPITTLGYYSYRTYMKSITSNVQVSANSTVHLVKDKVDTVLNNIRKNYLATVDDANVLWLLNEDIWYSDYSNLVAAGNVLGGPSYYADYIEGYSFINFNTNWVLSNRGMFPYDEVMNKEEVEAIWQMNQDSLIRDYWISNLTKDSSTQKREMINFRNLSLIIKLPVIQKDPYGLLAVNINMRNLENFIYQDIGEHEITVLSQNGEIIFSSNEQITDAIHQLYRESKETSTDFKEYRSVKVSKNQGQDKVKHYLSVVESDSMDWYYIASYNEELILEGGNDIIYITLTILGIMICVIAFAMLITHKLYMPIRNLANYVTGVTSNKGRKEEKLDHEFKYIAHRLEDLKDNATLLEKKIVSQLPQMIELFQIRLVRGEIGEEQLQDYLNNLKLHMPKFYVALAINIKSQNGFENYDEAKQDAIRMDVVKHMPTSILEELYIPPVCYARTILCTIDGDEEATLDQKVLNLYQQLEEYIFTTYGLKINIGVSSIQTILAKYPNSYSESITALRTNDLFNQEVIEDHHEIIFYSDIQSGNQGYIYDNFLERELKEAIDMGDKEKAFECIDRFIDSMVSHNVTTHDVTLSLHRILISIILVGYNSGLPVNGIFEKGLSDVFTKYHQLYDMNKIRSYLKYKIVERVVTKLEAYRTSRSGEIMLDIQRIIDESNGDITLTECAERLGYHPTYIWKVMKVEKNTTFSTYVSEYKLEVAKKLLIETELTVAEIAAKLNYTNAQNFIRFFSKLEGTTPGKYRQSNQKKL